VNKLLRRQLKKAFNLNSERELEAWLSELNGQSGTALDQAKIMEGFVSFINRVDETYQYHERDITLRDRSLQLNSEELIEANEKIREQVTHQKKVIDTLRHSVNQLLTEQGKPTINDSLTNISQLSSMVLDLIKKKQQIDNELLVQRHAMDKHGIVATVDINGTILSANNKCCQLSQFERDELIGRNLSIFRVRNLSIHVQVGILKKLIKGSIWNGELHSVTKRGTPWYVSATIVPILNEEALVDRLVILCTDISEQKRLEERLAARQHFFKSITDSIGEGVYAVDGNGTVQFLNPEARRLLGWELEDLKYQIFHDAVHYQRSDGTLLKSDECLIRSTTNNGNVYRSETDFFTDKRGHLFPISIIAVPLLDRNGKPDGHVGVFSDISERKATERKLQLAYQEAEKASKAKGDFLATMSHEIRTPMNAIIGLTHLALEADTVEQKQINLKKVKNSAATLLELINSILDFSKVDSQEIDVVKQKFNLSSLLGKLSQMFQHKARDKSLHLLFDIKCNSNSECVGDSDRLYQVLVNLLSNAIKFTDNGFVKLTIDANQSDIAFSVSDSGIGISENSLPSLFDAFVQADASISRNYGGTGLGLAISKKLVSMMGGTLSVDSIEGKGSHFHFSIPGMFISAAPYPTISLEQPLLCVSAEKGMTETVRILNGALSRLAIPFSMIDARHNALPTSNQHTILLLGDDQLAWDKIINHMKFGEFENLNIAIIITPLSDIEVEQRLGKYLPAHADIIEAPFTDVQLIDSLTPLQKASGEKRKEGLESKKRREKRLKGKHILVVEDDDISLEVTRQILFNSGLKVTSAKTGEMALMLCTKQRFDAILLDCMLPKMSGYQVSEQLCQQPFFTTPIIALSANISEQTTQKGIDAGMCAQITKPAKAKTILATLDSYIHSGYLSIDEPAQTDNFENDIYQFYLKYGKPDVLASLLTLLTTKSNDLSYINRLLEDAHHIGAHTLERSVFSIQRAAHNGNDYASKIAELSQSLDTTLSLIAHTLSASNKNRKEEVSNELPLTELVNVITSLKAYDADAGALLTNLVSNYSTSHLSHKLNKALQQVNVYDYDGAIETLVVVQENITNE